MDRTLIAINVPNLITVPLMAGFGFLVVSVVYQLALRAMGNAASNSTANTASGF